MKYEEEFRLLLGGPLEVNYKQLEWLYDIKHNIGVRKMQIDYNLQVGYVYDLTFEKRINEDSSCFSFIILKKEDNNVYYLAEFYNGHFYKMSEDSLGKSWKKCNVQDYGVDLNRCIWQGEGSIEYKVKAEIKVEDEEIKTINDVMLCPECGSNNCYTYRRRDYINKVIKGCNSFELTETEVDNYFEQIKNYIKLFYKPYHSELNKGVLTSDIVESLSSRQEICSKEAINQIFEGNYVEALHNVYDVLSDLNKNTPITYNEYVLLMNLILVYEKKRSVDNAVK